MLRHVFYLRNERDFPVACVASERSGDTIKVALSALSPKDKESFDRKRGRDIALGRLAKGRLFTTVPAGEEHIKQQVCREIAERSSSEQARTAAAIWLATEGVSPYQEMFEEF